MSRDRRAKAQLSASLLARPRTAQPLPSWPLARLSRPAALCLMAVLIAALALAALFAGQTPDAASEPRNDSFLQGEQMAREARIVGAMANGAPYYETALAEHQSTGAAPPAPPDIALSTLAAANALLTRGGADLAVVILLIANLLAWYRALAQAPSRTERIVAIVLVALDGWASFGPAAGLSHPLVAGLLASLALASYRPGFPAPALGLTGLAMAVEQCAVAYAIAWLVLALAERRGREAMLVSLLLAGWSALIWLHGFTIAELAGVPFEAVMFAQPETAPGFQSVLVPRLPGLFAPIAVVLVLLTVLGWIGSGGRIGFWIASTLLVIAISAHLGLAPPDWLLLMLPAFAAGLAFAPRALAQLAQAAFTRAASS